MYCYSENRRPSFRTTSPLSNDLILLNCSWQELTHLWGIRKGLNRWLLLGPSGPETPGLPATPSGKERKCTIKNVHSRRRSTYTRDNFVKGTVSRDGIGLWWHVWLVLGLNRGRGHHLIYLGAPIPTKTNHICHQKPNLSRETGPLKPDLNYMPEQF